MTMSLQQEKDNCNNVVTKYLMYFPLLQIVSGKGSQTRPVAKNDIADMTPPGYIFINYSEISHQLDTH